MVATNICKHSLFLRMSAHVAVHPHCKCQHTPKAMDQANQVSEKPTLSCRVGSTQSRATSETTAGPHHYQRNNWQKVVATTRQATVAQEPQAATPNNPRTTAGVTVASACNHPPTHPPTQQQRTQKKAKHTTAIVMAGTACGHPPSNNRLKLNHVVNSSTDYSQCSSWLCPQPPTRPATT